LWRPPAAFERKRGKSPFVQLAVNHHESTDADLSMGFAVLDVTFNGMMCGASVAMPRVAPV
jgi:hypothetical protein